MTAAITGTASVQAVRKKKKSRKKGKQKAAERAENQANQVCASQVAPCRTKILAECTLPGARCLAAADCCSTLGVCDTAGFFTCIVAVSN
jgi:hypothetical protein